MVSHDVTLQALRRESLLRHLSPSAWEGIVPEIEVVERRDSRYLLRRGEPAAHVYFVVAGAVRVFHRLDDQREVLLKIFCPPAMFGEIEVLCALPIIEHAMTLRASTLARLAAADFVRLVETSNAFAAAALRDVSMRLCIASSNERELAFTQVLPRLARLLLDHTGAQEEADGARRVSLSQEAMARDLGVTRKAVVASLAKLRELGLVVREGRHTRLPRPAELARLAPGAASLLHTSR